ncbi:site-2 protease family protein [Clostridium sp. 2-1]|uniref:Zn-dependent protease n=1 Tax=Clostridium beijerinckii TaxID=1520 RepID=A0AAX0B2M1_CLOBE|nr:MULTISPECIES: site-2 protease family protein [Clostridium]MBN7574013.1 site-2 protease family protein [Clostridium beijerinckii]MBN7577693.1 site-2 protease family protein [Clostridium beijerinckii]MBN7583763.1 site-2 protease family protein [Clostridium beijerinckii]MBO0519816.1 site-2 protease family protein [Clostridium beijerinckii]NOW02578.1 Zn-dependent protease [Clostridium beijerinckii]
MNSILNMILMIPGMLIAFTFHEYAHALVADKLGDKTPRFQGRLTLNPIAHIDPVGFVAVLIFSFGWAKPVQTNPSAYKNYYKDDLKVSLAGPIANFIVAIVAALVLGIYVRFVYGFLPMALAGVLYSMIYLIIVININIGLFNLIPIPGLDGFSLLRDLKPNTFYRFEEKFYQYQMLIMLALIFVGGRIIHIPAEIIKNALLKIFL